MSQIGSYGVYQTFCGGGRRRIDRLYPDSQAGCMVVGVKDGGAILTVQPMIQGADGRLKENRGNPIDILAVDFTAMPTVAPIGAGAVPG